MKASANRCVRTARVLGLTDSRMLASNGLNPLESRRGNRVSLRMNAFAHSLPCGDRVAYDLVGHHRSELAVPLEDATINHDGVYVRGFSGLDYHVRRISEHAHSDYICVDHNQIGPFARS